ncbi:hypothetical protein B484DRAFT_206731 [Ochromonadaceae sp. CCMP2298]|nr:hypothetical protein B484DRAFT_206731 [Ochromonadaceae sp. CCMP2298]
MAMKMGGGGMGGISGGSGGDSAKSSDTDSDKHPPRFLSTKSPSRGKITLVSPSYEGFLKETEVDREKLVRGFVPEALRIVEMGVRGDLDPALDISQFRLFCYALVRSYGQLSKHLYVGGAGHGGGENATATAAGIATASTSAFGTVATDATAPTVPAASPTPSQGIITLAAASSAAAHRLGLQLGTSALHSALHAPPPLRPPSLKDVDKTYNRGFADGLHFKPHLYYNKPLQEQLQVGLYVVCGLYKWVNIS